MSHLIETGKQARSASYFLASVSAPEKNKVLLTVARNLREHSQTILDNNQADLEKARQEGLSGPLIDRLLLNSDRIESMARGLEEISNLEDPVGEVLGMKKRPNGLMIGKKRVPLGVIGIIYESRPNVTVDVSGLCLKSGNAVILRGGKEAIRSNTALVNIIRMGLKGNGFPEDAVQLIEDTSRECALELMKLNAYLDVLIPRGGSGLIRSVVENSTVPVIETGVGNCHIYVDQYADPDKALSITINAKTQRPGVCNAAETLLVHASIANEFIPLVGEQLRLKKVEIRGDLFVRKLLPYAVAASEEDWYKEFLDLILAVKVVGSDREAIEHIRKYGSGHSECIVTENCTVAANFLDQVNSAAVYVNASTRFTDGYEFGLGAEIGISTQKLHARGPMGLKELTTTKYIIYGNGQIRI